MKKRYLMKCILFSLMLLCIIAVIVVIYIQNRSHVQAKISKYFKFNIPAEAQILFSEESAGFGDGRYLYIYHIPTHVMNEVVANLNFSGWSTLPFTDKVRVSLKNEYEGHVIGNKLKEYGLYKSKNGYYKFTTLDGKTIDFLSIQESAQIPIASQSNRDYTFCIFDIEHNLMLFFINIY